MRLRDLQKQFMAGIYGQSNAVCDYIHPSQYLSPPQRLAIYQSSVIANLVQALGDIYPVCGRLLGQEFFDAMAKRFIAKHPSEGPNL